MLELLGMMRPLNGIMALLGVLIGGIIAVGGNISALYSFPLLLALVAVFLINGAGNVFNDYADLDADKVNRPNRPMPSGEVSERTALIFTLILFAAGNLCALMINMLCFTIALANTFVLVMYSISLQHKVLLGNISIGYLVGSVFLFGGAAFAEIKVVLILMVLAMLSTITREIVKDLEDMEGDRKSFMKKLATKVSTVAAPIAERFGITTDGVKIKYKERSMVTLAVICLLIAVVMSILPFYYGILKTGYLAVVILADIIFVSCIYSLVAGEGKKKTYASVSKRLKMAMFVALISFIVGIFF
ncbi:MAG: UbiA family prenyltransferase [Candidatus Aenigmarchaeota archaeon]|nr:UbiA family prenyltransferase [Candidatus Aenigmarchaeota archaeon]